MRLAQHPKRPDEIYAALEINGVMRSTDLGETWSDCSAGLIKLAEQPHLQSKIVSDTTAEGMLDGHAVAINPADPDAAIVALRMGLAAEPGQPHHAGGRRRVQPGACLKHAASGLGNIQVLLQCRRDEARHLRIAKHAT